MTNVRKFLHLIFLSALEVFQLIKTKTNSENHIALRFELAKIEQKTF